MVIEHYVTGRPNMELYSRQWIRKILLKVRICHTCRRLHASHVISHGYHARRRPPERPAAGRRSGRALRGLPNGHPEKHTMLTQSDSSTLVIYKTREQACILMGLLCTGCISDRLEPRDARAFPCQAPRVSLPSCFRASTTSCRNNISYELRP